MYLLLLNNWFKSQGVLFYGAQTVIASEAKQSLQRCRVNLTAFSLDCFVLSVLAMTLASEKLTQIVSEKRH
jgi:hypothetical protein